MSTIRIAPTRPAQPRRPIAPIGPTRYPRLDAAEGRCILEEGATSKVSRRLRALLARLFPQPPTPVTRLRPSEAAAIAERAAARAGRPGTHGHAVPREVEGGVAWDVCQVSRGSGWRVQVDDATGEAGSVTRWGVR